ncbi:MAG: S-adenosylmethionine:tRNA ribosyltransferase-isomerase, partial [Planctomycetota bacterium]
MSEIDLYDYDLPQELIAQEPVGQRTDARLMLVDRSEGSIEHHHVRDLPSLVPAGDTMVMNNSRVMKARLVGYRKRTGGRWQGLFLQSDAETGIWEVLTKTRGTLQPGEAIVIQDRDGRDGMHLLVIDRTDT